MHPSSCYEMISVHKHSKAFLALISLQFYCLLPFRIGYEWQRALAYGRSLDSETSRAVLSRCYWWLPLVSILFVFGLWYVPWIQILITLAFELFQPEHCSRQSGKRESICVGYCECWQSSRRDRYQTLPLSPAISLCSSHLWLNPGRTPCIAKWERQTSHLKIRRRLRLFKMDSTTLGGRALAFLWSAINRRNAISGNASCHSLSPRLRGRTRWEPIIIGLYVYSVTQAIINYIIQDYMIQLLLII